MSKQINKNPTTLIRIDAELHRLLKIKAAGERTTIRTLVEGTCTLYMVAYGVWGVKIGHVTGYCYIYHLMTRGIRRAEVRQPIN